ncbi:uncharacterized protein LOC113770989 [Coffea eugenioides]|uniref:uncharacterized protein LOC113770989 n=1 Tax=Coffea eugenioides TaxID=49369 RepID=UPI000F610AC2|nr:uncharacterized protein LOC113770989 [Coffea eugenioides]
MVVHLCEILLCSAMIKSLFWNARGVDNTLTIARLQKLKCMCHISLIALCEPLVGREHLDIVRRKLGFPFGVSNVESRIWIFFDAEYECDIAVASPQFLAVKITYSYFRCPFITTFVHAPCALEEREQLWQQLLRVSQMGVLTIFLGDFNVITSAKEKQGGWPFRFVEVESFLNFTEEAALTDLGFSGPKFTWCNNRRGRARIWKCLDRALVNQMWLDLAVNTSVTHLLRVASDHSPLLVTCSFAIGSGPPSFRFLEAVKDALRLWNKEVFGNVFDCVREREERVLSLEGSLETNPIEEGERLLTQVQCDLKAALLQEARYWRQKTCVRWLKEGDANIRFFHAQFKQRCVHSYIHRIKDMNDIWVDDRSQIESMAIEYFSEILVQQAQVPVDHSLLDIIPSVVSEQDNETLQQLPTEDEIQRVVFQLNGDNCSGLMGLPALSLLRVGML